MKAIVYKKYGPPDVVALAEVPKPTPGGREVLIRIHATTVTGIDRTYPLESAAEAHAYVDQGRKRGNVVNSA